MTNATKLFFILTTTTKAVVKKKVQIKRITLEQNIGISSEHKEKHYQRITFNILEINLLT